MDHMVRTQLGILWEYMHLNSALRQADCIVGFGNYNLSIPERAAQLYHQGLAPVVLFTGGLGRNTDDKWTGSEAARFAEVAMACGVPAENILLEDRSANTAENILFTRELLQRQGLEVHTILGVHQPFMERRIWAALQVYWPEVDAVITSPLTTVEEYLRNSALEGLDEKTAIDVIVGDFQRIDVYARKGYQVPQEIPKDVWDAFHVLVDRGYTSQLVIE